MARRSASRRQTPLEATDTPESGGQSRRRKRRGPKSALSDSAFTENATEPIHRWVPWIAGFSARFVEEIIETRFGSGPRGAERPMVLDPFAGVGTTLVEALKHRCDAVGFEINPYAAFAAQTKLDSRNINLRSLDRAIARYRDYMQSVDEGNGRCAEPRSRAPAGFSTRTPFYSPAVERKVLHTLDFIRGIRSRKIRDLFRLAFASVMVQFSNYSYEPSLTRRSVAGKSDVADADVAQIVCEKLSAMRQDIAALRARIRGCAEPGTGRVINASFFCAREHLAPASVDLVVTSPPYVNNYHYVRNTRPHLHWLGFADSAGELKDYEEQNFGKFWQNVRQKPDVGLEFELPALEALLGLIRERNAERGVYGGHGWANYAAAYFNDSYRFCGILSEVLRPGAHAIVVLGNSILQGIEVRTDEIFAEIAGLCGLRVEAIHLLRTKRTGSSIINSTVRAGGAPGKAALYESAVELAAPAGHYRWSQKQ